MQYNVFFTLIESGKTFKVFQRLAETEVLDILRLQGIQMDGIQLNVLVRGEFKSGNAQLNGQVGFWDIEEVR